MISESEALERILAAMSPMNATAEVLFEALDRFAAEDVTATVPIPAFDMSSMDGYALLAAESTAGSRHCSSLMSSLRAWTWD
jgi:molybdopterin molybdotransferase